MTIKIKCKLPIDRWVEEFEATLHILSFELEHAKKLLNGITEFEREWYKTVLKMKRSMK